MINMEILFKGLNAKEGIFFRCDYCRCEWLAQNRNDLQVTFEFDLSSYKKIPVYDAPCPCCNNKIYLGPDPRDLPLYTSKWSSVFSRDDWIEKFSVEGISNE